MKKGLALVLALLLTLMMSGCLFGGKEKYEEFDWKDLTLSEWLPEPERCYGKIVNDSSNGMWIDLGEVTKSDFRSYRDRCVAQGYDIEPDESGTMYDVYNNEGYHLRLLFSESNEEITIDLDAPEEMSELTWPTNGLGTLLPLPASLYGRICYDNSESFIVHIGHSDRQAYAAYVTQCEDSGFTLEHSKSEKYFNAKNEQGYEITLHYLRGSRYEISLKAPKGEDATTVAQTSTPNDTKPATTEPSNTEPSTGEIRPDFKAAMDAYETFMDEYVAFMIRYRDSEGGDLSLMGEYLEFVSEYAKAVEAFDAWEEDDLNDAEVLYYTQVSARITQKLLQIAG